MVDVYLWMYHTDLWPEFYTLLYPIKHEIILHAGLCKDKPHSDVVADITSNFPHYNLTYHNNAGGDILPFITDFSNNSNKQNFFIKIHTKKSTLRNRIQWRIVLLNSLMGGVGGESFYLNKNYLANNSHIGSLTHRSLILKHQEHTNTQCINNLLQYYSIPNNTIKHRTFAAGTMFMSRSALYAEFFNSVSLQHLTTLLEQERGYVSDARQGKYCHSLERIFGYICEYKNYKMSCSKYRTIRIINSKSPTRKLHLIMTYNDYVYIEENIGVHGKVLHCSEDGFTIEWHHMPSVTVRQYKKIENKTYIGCDE